MVIVDLGAAIVLMAIFAFFAWCLSGGLPALKKGEHNFINWLSTVFFILCVSLALTVFCATAVDISNGAKVIFFGV